MISRHWQKALDGILFFGLLVLGQLLAIHGKATSSFLLVKHDELVRPPADRWEIYLTVVLAALALSLVRISRWGSGGRILTVTVVAVLSPLAVRVNDQPSSLIFFLDMFFLVHSGGVAWANSLLAQRMAVRYWELLFDNAIKAAQILITVYGVLLAALGVVSNKPTSEKQVEDILGYLTTATYPTLVVGLVLFFIGYWVIHPTWQMIGNHYRQSKKPRHALKPTRQSLPRQRR